MSTTLYWKPVTLEAGYLPDELKYILQKRYEGYIEGVTIGPKSLNYLEGLKDAGVKGAEELMELIEQHEKIRIWESS